MAVEDRGMVTMRYVAPWPVYCLAWSHRQDSPFRLAVGSFREQYENKVTVISLNEVTGKLEESVELEHSYPATKVGFVPDLKCVRRDLVATAGEFLCIYELEGGNFKSVRKLRKNRADDQCAPLTSFDWNETDPSLLGTSSVDTTCTVWNVETQQAKIQLIAHDREVYDFAFASGVDVFASVGADGSVRLFDLRSLEHSQVLYESPDMAPLMRVCWNKMNPNYLATFKMESAEVIVLDIRYPPDPVATLVEPSPILSSPAHPQNKNVNAIAWAPYSSYHLCSVGESGRAIIWNVPGNSSQVEEPILSYDANRPIDNIQWSVPAPNWIAVATGNTVSALRV